MWLTIPFVGIPSCKMALLMFGIGLTGSIYVVCPPILSEFAPASQRTTLIVVLSISNTLAGILAPMLSGAMIEKASTPLEGYHNGFMVDALVQVLGGLAGLLLLRPGTEPATQAGDSRRILRRFT
jgi:MFS transporter, ACS family, D-galactonate transporter